MHHDGPDLEALAASTFSSLTSIWDDIGCPEAERDAFISKLSDDVAAIYRSRVDCQEARRRDMIAEAAELETTIENMHHAMEQPPVVVRCWCCNRYSECTVHSPRVPILELQCSHCVAHDDKLLSTRGLMTANHTCAIRRCAALSRREEPAGIPRPVGCRPRHAPRGTQAHVWD